MSFQRQKHKTIKRYHEPGDFHELTFSCYRQMPLLANDLWREKLARTIDRAMKRWEFLLHAFVFMPTHVHLLAYPTGKPAISSLRKTIKRPYSFQIKQILVESRSPLLETLTVRERPGKKTFRFWQERPGYDRNFDFPGAILASLDYVHLNPVKGGLCLQAGEWRWSSARFYQSDGEIVDPDLPKITPLPVEVLDCNN